MRPCHCVRRHQLRSERRALLVCWSPGSQSSPVRSNHVNGQLQSGCRAGLDPVIDPGPVIAIRRKSPLAVRSSRREVGRYRTSSQARMRTLRRYQSSGGFEASGLQQHHSSWNELASDGESPGFRRAPELAASAFVEKLHPFFDQRNLASLIGWVLDLFQDLLHAERDLGILVRLLGI